MDAKTEASIGCPMGRPTTVRSLLGRTNRDWWPEALPLDILHQGGLSPDPMGEAFDYAAAFNALDCQSLKDDLTALMTDSQPWWPADYRHYGPLFIRMAWHAAGMSSEAPFRGGHYSCGKDVFINSCIPLGRRGVFSPVAATDRAFA